MKTQEAINVMKKYTDTDSGLSTVVIKAHNMAIAALEKQRWIPVTERLPVTEDGYVHVVVSMDDEFVCTTDYTDGEGFELWADSGEVIAWMPLPEPYKED